ncbi:MAG: isoprenylcysteine carboxylmethyltransferase family protein [Candidatus Kariarchaeaceae archaeon]|jgi:protein-S-isoprenylcysteine O-methyltransferase Ste14
MMIAWDLLLRYLVIWAGFGLLHSLLASDFAKETIPINGRSYRIFYNIISGLSFLIALAFLPSITVILQKVLNLSAFRSVIFLLSIMIGSLILLIGLSNWNLKGFLGLGDENDPLTTTGIYAFSRHPVYTGILVIFLATLIIEISANSLSWILGAGGYFVLGSIPEENKLQNFHQGYFVYKQNVGRFFPWKRRHFDFLKNNK